MEILKEKPKLTILTDIDGCMLSVNSVSNFRFHFNLLAYYKCCRISCKTIGYMTPDTYRSHYC